MASYLTTTEFKARTILPFTDVDAVGSTYTDSRLAIATSEINGRLRKRYAIPFAAPVPEVVLGWVTAIVTVEVMFRRGWDPASEQGLALIAAADRARAEVKEAADSDSGLWDLPVREDVPEPTAVAKGGPFSYSEASPYSWLDVQRDTLQGGGT